MKPPKKNFKVVKANLKEMDSLKLSYYLFSKLGSLENLKIHKLIYYIDAYHLAYFEKPFVKENFQAWIHGPVIKELYSSFRHLNVNVYDKLKLDWDKNKKEEFISKFESELTESQKDLLADVINEFGNLSAYQLETLTHSETPWIEARKGYAPADLCTKIISKDIMKSYYREKMYTTTNDTQKSKK